MKKPLTWLPLRTLRHGLEISVETERLLFEAMNRLETEDYEDALQAALEAFLSPEMRKKEKAE